MRLCEKCIMDKGEYYCSITGLVNAHECTYGNKIQCQTYLTYVPLKTIQKELTDRELNKRSELLKYNKHSYRIIRRCFR